MGDWKKIGYKFFSCNKILLKFENILGRGEEKRVSDEQDPIFKRQAVKLSSWKANNESSCN